MQKSRRDAPSTGEYRPGGQGTGSAVPSSQKWPVVHWPLHKLIEEHLIPSNASHTNPRPDGLCPDEEPHCSGACTCMLCTCMLCGCMLCTCMLCTCMLYTCSVCAPSCLFMDWIARRRSGPRGAHACRVCRGYVGEEQPAAAFGTQESEGTERGHRCHKEPDATSQRQSPARTVVVSLTRGPGCLSSFLQTQACSRLGGGCRRN